ncbi:uncharacterized protein [Argopecten irradians]|uniref:uncharacterized protein n=1 Tax=Argopecten irradians TaxID=31199 RepID=UPI00371E45D2
MTKLKKRWIIFFADFKHFVLILIYLLQLIESTLTSTTTQTPIPPLPPNYEGQAPWQRRSSPQQPWNQRSSNVGKTSLDIPWEQEQLLPMQGYQGRNQGRDQNNNQGKPPRSFMKFYPDALDRRPSPNQAQNQGAPASQLDVEAIRREMSNKELSLRETGQNNPGRKSVWQGGDNPQQNQTAWNGERRRGPETPPPYWRSEGPYSGRDQGRPYRGRDGYNQDQMRPYPGDRRPYPNARDRPPTYPPPTYSPPYNRGPGRWNQPRGTPPGPRGWDGTPPGPRGWDGPYNRQGGGYPNQGARRRPDNRGGPGSGVGSGHLMMVDPDLPDPLDDHWQRMQTHKAWEMMSGGSGHGPGLPPVVPPRRWGDRGVVPGGPTTPPWPNMDKRQRQNTGRAKIWAEEGSGFVGESGQSWNGRWSPPPNGTNPLNATVRNPTNITGNSTPAMNEFQRQAGSIPPPPPTSIIQNYPSQHPRDRWNYRMEQLAAWERQQRTGGRPFPYEHPVHEAKKEREEERLRGRGQTTWPYQSQTNPPYQPQTNQRPGSQVQRSGVGIPDQRSRRPPVKLSDLSPSLASILGNMTDQVVRNRPDRPAMTHTFPPYQENPDTRNRFTDIPGRGMFRQGQQLQPPNIPRRTFSDTGGQRAFIGGDNQTKEVNQTDPDGPVAGEGQQNSHDTLLGPILARAKLRGFDVDHEQESETESEDGQLRKIIVGTYLEKLAIKEGDGGSGYDPFKAAMADINSTLWSTLKNVSQNRDRGMMGNYDISPQKSAAAFVPTDKQRLGSGRQQSWTTQGQSQDSGFQRRVPPPNPKPGVIPHMDTVLQRPTGMPAVTGRGLNPLLVRGGNSGTPRTGQSQPPPPWLQQGQGSPTPRPGYNPHNPRTVFVPQDVYNPQAYDPKQVYNVQGHVGVTVSPDTTPISPPDNNDQNQNNDQNNDIEEILPVGTKILPHHIPKILAVLNVTLPNTTPQVLVASQMDGVRPGNNNVPARMINIPEPTELQTATEFLQVSTQRTITTESTSSAFGVIIACLVACTVVIGPGICIGCRMRQKAKQRERKRAAAAATRNEESGIMEAIIMSELGRSALNHEECETKGARSKSRSERGTFHELQTLRSGRQSPTIIVH